MNHAEVGSFLGTWRSCPKSRINPEVVHLVNQDDEVMAENFRQRFIDHRGVRPAAERLAEFPFHHGECRFDVAPLVIPPEPSLAVVQEQSEHLFPHAERQRGDRGFLIGDVGRAADARDHFRIAAARIALIGRDLTDREVFCRRLHERRKLRRVSRIAAVNLNGGHDVRLNAAHDVRLDPSVPALALVAILVLRPGVEARRAEPGRVHGEIGLDRAERPARFRDEGSQDRRDRGILQHVQDRVVARRRADEAARLRFAEIGHEPARGERRVDLERGAEHGVGDRETRTPAPALARRLRKSTAEIAEQHHEVIFLVRLRRVVGWPILRIGAAHRLVDPEGLRDPRVAIWGPLTLHDGFHSEDVLALHAARLEIEARARRRFAHDDGVFARPGLRGNNPSADGAPDTELGGDFESALLSWFHDKPPCYYLPIVDTSRVDLSIPFVYTFGQWQEGAGTRGRNWEWSCCSAHGAGAGMSGFPALAGPMEPSSGLPYALSASRHDGTSPSGKDELERSGGYSLGFEGGAGEGDRTPSIPLSRRALSPIELPRHGGRDSFTRVTASSLERHTLLVFLLHVLVDLIALRDRIAQVPHLGYTLQMKKCRVNLTARRSSPPLKSVLVQVLDYGPRRHRRIVGP